MRFSPAEVEQSGRRARLKSAVDKHHVIHQEVHVPNQTHADHYSHLKQQRMTKILQGKKNIRSTLLFFFQLVQGSLIFAEFHLFDYTIVIVKLMQTVKELQKLFSKENRVLA